MASADGTYAPKSPDLSFLASDQAPLPPAPTLDYQHGQHHGRTPSADFMNQSPGSSSYPSNGAGSYYHGGPPAQAGFAGSPGYSSYNNLPTSQGQPPQPHMTSPHPPLDRASGFPHPTSSSPGSASHIRYDSPSYNNNSLPPYSQPQQHHPQYHTQPTPPPMPHTSGQHYNPIHHLHQPGYSPPPQASHLPAIQQHSQPPQAHPSASYHGSSAYGQHAPTATTTPSVAYSQQGLQESSHAYQNAQFSNPQHFQQSNFPPANHTISSEMPPKPAAPVKEPEIMFSPVKTKFPTARIKRIMQADEEVGKVAQQTPIAVGKALELFMVQLVTKSADVARDKNSKRITAQMLKQVIDSGQEWDFLQDIVAKVTDEKEGAKGAKAKAESETDEEIEPVEPKKRGRGGGRKKKAAE